jgi:hypothetical protein
MVTRGENPEISGSVQNDASVRSGALVPEPFVDADTVAEFLSDSRDEVLKLTRAGKIRGYPYKGRQRHVYRYRLSEVAEDMAALRKPAQSKIPPAAPVSRRKSNG